jgi:cytochrome c oxidase assembly factor CtaG
MSAVVAPPLATTWFDPAVLSLVVVLAGWYRLGNRRPALREVGTGRRPSTPSWRPLAFYGALLATLLALDSPIEGWSHTLLWAHMGQHLLLMMVAAPLIVLAAPWNALWRPLPLGFRRAVAGGVVQGRAFGPLRKAARVLSLPVAAWLLFNGDLALWHVPWFYDLTLQNTAVHYAEHFSFVLFGCLFWAQVIDSRPFHPRLGHFGRAVFATAGSVAGWLLAVVLALAPAPLYSAYSSLPSRPGGISALTDQQLAGGMMWGPGSIPFAIVVFWAIYRWLGDDEPRRRRRSAAAPLRPETTSR